MFHFSFCKEPGRVFVWSFQTRQLPFVSGLRRNMGYMRVGCRAGVFAHLVNLPCCLPCGRPIIKTWKPSVRGLPGSRPGCTGLTNEVWEWVLRSRIFDTCSSSWNRGFHDFPHISAYMCQWARRLSRVKLAVICGARLALRRWSCSNCNVALNESTVSANIMIDFTPRTT